MDDVLHAAVVFAWWLAANEFGAWLYRRTPAHLHDRLDRILFWIVAVTWVAWIVWDHHFVWPAGGMPVPCVPPTCTPD